ncbi:MAG: quinol:cytochrome C oxidoreductase [Verrucomicrobia bacterium]|nr:MAG: quinol:cytochrome C oxidoreductase [Verrucomicrobiota bacterium]
MRSETKASTAPLDLSKWRNLPRNLMAGGGFLVVVGLIVTASTHRLQQFGYSWLLAFMFFLSICLGALFLVLVHHLFDAGWSVPIRRFCEHISTILFPWMALLFLPIALLAKKIYPWMHEPDPQLDHALKAKAPLFTVPGFYLLAAACFGVWWLLSNRLRYWSLKQDETGGALPTHRMRRYSAIGIFLFAFSLTLAVVMWMKALQHEWFSTMYGVYYFAGSTWLMLATAYVITMVLDRQGVLSDVLHEHQYYFLGSVMFAFTVFYAYVTFAQYFIIWNGNMPEETFWYVVREKGTWWYIGLIIIFGHFFLPFLALLRIDVKNLFFWMLPLCLWAWLMHWVDLSFNIMPVLHPNGFPWQWLWLDAGCFAFIGGVVAAIFLREYAMGFFHPVPTQISDGELDQADDLRDAPPQFGGGKL